MWSGHVWRGPLKKCKQNILRVRGATVYACIRISLCGCLVVAPTNGVYNVLLLLLLSAAAPRGCRAHTLWKLSILLLFLLHSTMTGTDRGRGRRNRIQLMVAFPLTLCKLNSALFWHAWQTDTDTVASCTYNYICILSALHDVDLIDLMIPLACARKAS